MLMTIEELSKLVHNPILIDLGHFSLSLIELPLKMHQSTPLLSTAGCVTWFRTFFSQFLSQIQGFQCKKDICHDLMNIFRSIWAAFRPKKGLHDNILVLYVSGCFYQIATSFFCLFSLCHTKICQHFFFCTADRHFNLINTPSTFLAKLPTKSKWA